MYIELIDLLRCPREHEETWLVAAFTRMNGRYVVTGALGCPACNASYEIENGVADLRDRPEERRIETTSATPRRFEDVEGSAIRIAAMLGLLRPNALIALRGDEAALAVEISELAQCRVFAMNPADSIGDTEKVATVLARARLPFATSSLDGILLSADDDGVADAARILKPGGRLVMGSRAAIPPSFHELARDENYVVSESVGPLIKLSR